MSLGQFLVASCAFMIFLGFLKYLCLLDLIDKGVVYNGLGLGLGLGL